VDKIVAHSGKGTNTKFEVLWKSGDKAWFPYSEVAHLASLAAYLEAFGATGISNLPIGNAKAPDDADSFLESTFIVAEPDNEIFVGAAFINTNGDPMDVQDTRNMDIDYNPTHIWSERQLTLHIDYSNFLYRDNDSEPPIPIPANYNDWVLQVWTGNPDIEGRYLPRTSRDYVGRPPSPHAIRPQRQQVQQRTAQQTDSISDRMAENFIQFGGENHRLILRAAALSLRGGKRRGRGVRGTPRGQLRDVYYGQAYNRYDRDESPPRTRKRGRSVTPVYRDDDRHRDNRARYDSPPRREDLRDGGDDYSRRGRSYSRDERGYREESRDAYYSRRDDHDQRDRSPEIPNHRAVTPVQRTDAVIEHGRDEEHRKWTKTRDSDATGDKNALMPPFSLSNNAGLASRNPFNPFRISTVNSNEGSSALGRYSDLPATRAGTSWVATGLNSVPTLSLSALTLKNKQKEVLGSTPASAIRVPDAAPAAQLSRAPTAIPATTKVPDRTDEAPAATTQVPAVPAGLVPEEDVEMTDFARDANGNILPQLPEDDDAEKEFLEGLDK
jgi:hypothetical protein